MFGPPEWKLPGCLELISQFDPFLREHIVRIGDTDKGTRTYLSFTVFIDLMGKNVLSVTLAKY